MWNVYHSSDRVVKMTSPHMNLIMCAGSLLACISVPLDGLSALSIRTEVIAYLKSVRSVTDPDDDGAKTCTCLIQFQLVFCILPLAFTLVFGSTALKLWRIFVIFSNINVKRHNTKDSCLFAILSAPVLLDLAVLAPIVSIDRIHCNTQPVSETYLQSYKMQHGVILRRNALVCGNQFWWLWVLIIYLLKVPLGILAIYFSWRIRHVTLASLREKNRISLAVCSACGLALVSAKVGRSFNMSHVLISFFYQFRSVFQHFWRLAEMV